MQPGEALCGVETDKAVVDFEMQEEGYVAAILFPEGTKDVVLGTTIAILVDEEKDVAAFKNYKEGSAPVEAAPAKAAPAAPAKKAAPAKSYPDHVVLEMPNLSPTMEKGNISKWHKKVGDSIGPGEALCGVETDKAVVDFEMQEEGFIAKILYPDGSKDIPLGEPVAILAFDKADVAAFADWTPSGGSQEAAAPETPAAQASTPVSNAARSSPKSASGDRIFVSPIAKKLAEEKGVDLSTISGTGPNDRIILADIEDALKSGQPVKVAKDVTVQKQAPAKPQAVDMPNDMFKDIQVSQIRKVIAERLTHSKQNIPHYYVTVSVQVDKLLQLRGKLNKVSSSKISVNDFVMKAASIAALKVPETNSSWQGDFVRQFNNVNMSFAVSTDNGLMAPVLHNINLKGLEQIATEVKQIAGRARENKLSPAELSGGTFTISNLGMFGVSNFSAIINPPQACILAVSAAEKKVVPREGAKEGEDPYQVIQVMNVTLSSDHRVVDGAVAAAWGQEFKKLIENPEMMLL